MPARRAIDAQPSHLTVRPELDKLAETVVEEVGLDRAHDVLFVDDPTQIGKPSTPKAIARRVAKKVAEKTVRRDDVFVSCGCKG